uniref:Uncharacterized protein n=1 Tax=uncultured prokaryote TaxID=198431 RepID=A0A0H5Q328_9ZZZZ|nr:hypothetical protein [uncultured prokaryote]
MGRKLTSEEISFLFASSLFMDSSTKYKFLYLLVEHFCDCSDKRDSPISACLLFDTDRGLDSE